MVIAIIADDKKKELMAQFCIAYCGILSKHRICATGITGKYVSEATGLKIEKLLSGTYGGAEQITSRIAYNEIDLVLFFRDANDEMLETEIEDNLLRACDLSNVPVATNIATAEILVMALESGGLDWREFVNPTSEYNQSKK
jgi:methylglyoxal synthase